MNIENISQDELLDLAIEQCKQKGFKQRTINMLVDDYKQCGPQNAISFLKFPKMTENELICLIVID